MATEDSAPPISPRRPIPMGWALWQLALTCLACEATSSTIPSLASSRLSEIFGGAAIGSLEKEHWFKWDARHFGERQLTGTHGGSRTLGCSGP